MFQKRTNSGICSICGRDGASLKITDGLLCRYCVPVTYSFERLTVADVVKSQIADAEMRRRVDVFQTTASFGILLFDQKNHMIMKGNYPNYHLPIMLFDEIESYSINADSEPYIFNSIDGKRAVFKDISEDYLKTLIKNYSEFSLDMTFVRKNVKFRRYALLSSKSRLADSKIETMEEIVKLSRILDEIVECNYRRCVG